MIVAQEPEVHVQSDIVLHAPFPDPIADKVDFVHNLLQVFPNVFLCAKTQSKVYNRLLNPRGSCGGGTPKCTCSAQAGDSMAAS